MPISYTVDEAANVFYARAVGVVTAQELLRYDEETSADLRIRPRFRELFDATSAVPEDIGPEVLDLLVAREQEESQRLPGSKTAVVAPTNATFDLAKEYERRVHGKTVIVFAHLNVALAWLGCAPPPPEWPPE